MAMQPLGFQILLKRLYINVKNFKQFQPLLSVQTQCHALEAPHGSTPVYFFTLYDQKTSVKRQYKKKRASVSGQMMTFKRIQQRRNNGGRDFFKHN